MGDDDLAAVADAVATGRDHVNHGRPLAAGECYRDALERLDDLPVGPEALRLRARAEMGLALVETDLTNDAEAGLVHLARAEESLPDDAEDLRVALLGQRAILLVRAGRHADALDTFDQAEPLLSRTTASHRASLHLNRSVLEVDLGRFADAREHCARAIEEAYAAAQPRTAYKARHNLAVMDYLEGDLPRAIDAMGSAPDHPDGTAEDPDHFTLVDRGRVLVEAGLVAEADDLLARAQALFEREQRGRDLGEVTLVRAEAALVAGDLDGAEALATDAEEVFAASDNDWWWRRAELIALEVARRRPTAADLTDGTTRELRRRARDLVDGAGDVDSEVALGARLLEIELACALGDLDTAAAELDTVELRDWATPRIRLRWHLCRASLALARADDDVLARVEEGVAALAEAQAQVGSRDLRTAMALHGRPLVDIGVQAALERGSVEELHRAVDLAHAASSRLTPVRANLPDADRELLAELRALEDRRWRETDAPEQAREQWATRAGQLREELRRRSWRQAGSTDGAGPDPVVSLDQLGSALGDAVVAVSFVRSGDDLVALRVTADTAEPIRLGPVAPILAEVGRLRADLRVVNLPGLAPAMRTVIRESLRTGLARLDAILAVPLDAVDRDLVVVPHADLALVPWSLLPSRAGVGTVSSPSVTRWVRRRGRPAVVDPVVAALAGPDLDRARDEVAGVLAQWGRAATTTRGGAHDLRRALANDDVLHLAAHGVHHAAAPLFSSVRLDDGPFYAHDLATASTTRVAVLSACDVAEHAMRPGDEPLGFAAALLDTGIDVVVGSVAPIRDDVAAAAGTELHRHLAAGRSPARAVSEVVAAAWEDGAVAPVVVLGNGLGPVAAPASSAAA